MREFSPVRSIQNQVTVRNRGSRAGAHVETVQLATHTSSDHDTDWSLSIDGGLVRGRC